MRTIDTKYKKEASDAVWDLLNAMGWNATTGCYRTFDWSYDYTHDAGCVFVKEDYDNEDDAPYDFAVIGWRIRIGDVEEAAKFMAEHTQKTLSEELDKALNYWDDIYLQVISPNEKESAIINLSNISDIEYKKHNNEKFNWH